MENVCIREKGHWWKLAPFVPKGGGRRTLQLHNSYFKVWSMAEREVSPFKPQRQTLREVTFLAGENPHTGAAWSRDFMGVKRIRH